MLSTFVRILLVSADADDAADAFVLSTFVRILLVSADAFLRRC